MKRTLLALLMAIGLPLSSEAFFTNKTYKTINIDKEREFRDGNFKWNGYEDQHVQLTLKNDAGALNVSSYFFTFKASRRVSGGTSIVYIAKNVGDTKVLGNSNVIFDVTKDQIPPDNTYNWELLMHTATTNLVRSAGQGTIQVIESLFDDADGSWQPASFTNLSDYLTIAAHSGEHLWSKNTTQSNIVRRSDVSITSNLYVTGSVKANRYFSDKVVITNAIFSPFGEQHKLQLRGAPVASNQLHGGQVNINNIFNQSGASVGDLQLLAPQQEGDVIIGVGTNDFLVLGNSAAYPHIVFSERPIVGDMGFHANDDINMNNNYVTNATVRTPLLAGTISDPTTTGNKRFLRGLVMPFTGTLTSFKCMTDSGSNRVDLWKAHYAVPWSSTGDFIVVKANINATTQDQNVVSFTTSALGTGEVLIVESTYATNVTNLWINAEGTWIETE